MTDLGYCWAHAGEHAEAGDCVRWSLPRPAWKCAAPDEKLDAQTFDIDVYDCPCGHPYGAHDYTRANSGAREMLILGCNSCKANLAPSSAPMPAPDGPAPVASETTPPLSEDPRVAELRRELANAKDDLAAVVSVNVALNERLRLDEEHRMRNGNYAAGYAAGAREAAGRPALTAHEVNAAAVNGVITVLTAEETTPPPKPSPLTDVANIIANVLMTRKGEVVTMELAIERARTASQAIAHLVRGSGYE